MFTIENKISKHEAYQFVVSWNKLKKVENKQGSEC